jgi:hypothetical protein
MLTGALRLTTGLPQHKTVELCLDGQASLLQVNDYSISDCVVPHLSL